MKRSIIRDPRLTTFDTRNKIPDYVSLHPGYVNYQTLG